ncbi:hypothetical protein QQ045_000081 [Rhodiola kirilowii]
MKTLHILSLLLLLPLLASCMERQVYIAYFGNHNGDKALHEIEASHQSLLASVKDSQEEEEATSSLLYSYKHSFNGFAAVMTPEEASRLSKMEGVVSVFPSEKMQYSAQTTRTWELMGLEESGSERLNQRVPGNEGGGDLLLKARYGSDVIIGVLDSGVWPESKSFSDEGMGPVPSSWKGICQTGDSFTSANCNRKLIGARYYIKGYERAYGPLNTTTDYRSPRDKDGHGTHTTSTVGGRAVPQASALGGFASGTASGGAPLSRLAIYKVCWPIPNQPKVNGNTCLGEDMLAALDDAVADGVHVVSISIGTSKPYPYRMDSLAIGSLHAFLKNVVVSCSAGNSGPAASTLSNTAPWIITVGASTVDRAFIAPVLLGNGQKIEGQTVTPYKLGKKMYPLVYAGDIALPTVAKDVSGQCLPNSLSPALAKGKIILCMRGNGTRIAKGMEVKRAGGAGYILGNSPANGAEIPVDPHVLPATAISSDDAIKVRSYIDSTKNPVATIGLAKTVLHTKPAPSMAAFTSRGPNIIDPNILKPDITAPGVNILAAWSEGISPTKFEDDPRTVKYNILSGTSMSCPHVGAAAALVKAIHPTWSSAAIRSALMTSAGLVNNKGTELLDPYGKPATPFQFGSGHLVPTRAADPGLVYNASTEDYLLYLCSIDRSISGSSFQCPETIPSANNLNYPSVAIPNLNGTTTVTRTVTNVGGRGKSVYFVSIKQAKGFQIKISPSFLVFKDMEETKSFTITVKPKHAAAPQPSREYAFGWFTWSDKVHDVRSPIAVAMA